MPPRPSLHSLLLMAASAAAAGGGDSVLLLAARRRLPVAAAAGGHRIRLLHSFSGSRLPRRPEVVCCVRSAPDARPAGPVAVRSRNVHSGNSYTAACEERLGQLVQKLKKEGIHPKQWRLGNFQRMMCPKCNGGSTEEMSLSVYIRMDGMNATWNCFRSTCGWRGFVQPDGVSKVSQANSDIGSETDQEVEANNAANMVYRKLSEEDLNLEPLCDELITYFSERMISAATLRRNKVMQRNWNSKIVIAFTYRRDGILVGCKYREVSKRFSQEAKTERILYGLDDIKRAHDVIIVEGEIDKLSMEEAGYRNCVSVPDGAPPQVSDKLPNKNQDKKYLYLWNCKDYLDSASRIILATDADPPGQALAEELARRLGKERCWRVNWPKRNKTDICKDANEVLMFLGPQALKKVVEDAELYPIRGLFSFRDFFPEIDNYYLGIRGDELGICTGWKSMDDIYKVVPGELTVVTGVPNSGKSEWIDALMCNINSQCGWKFVLCSMENKVREHARKLLEKRIKKPFFDARYGGSVERMTPDEFQEGKQWLNETFHLIRCEDDSLPSINWVLDLAKAAVLRYGVRGLVIDPYNELDHQRPSNQTETEYVSQILTKIKRFAQHHSCHVWFVAHPRQLHNWNGGPPNMYDISGSAHFINKCDNGIVIHRNRDSNAGPIDVVQVCVRKVRNKVVGQIGDAFLSYDRVTGEFKDADEVTVAAVTAAQTKKHSRRNFEGSRST
ncbi:twinkle homolog protein, chloroplastic/mitochondrial-like [Phragmites australis]|uniref:twinkle homolog protein, chloroplastic/mitochondrial-like n=1 Tax=Phragmites australis TaxID=29695 RepID=UPI002D7820CA|nr:twinkle homolog protein, chloroplastic/mitochondrial-like [Phragmites australis]XP_062178422.1 twinkle homolog protein, chloroplastic/mitochondrial-like [Phragmites australis]